MNLLYNKATMRLQATKILAWGELAPYCFTCTWLRRLVFRMLQLRIVQVFLVIVLAFASHTTYYFVTTKDKKIAQRAFTIGNWEACQSGPTLFDRYISNLSYAYIYLNKNFESKVGKYNSLVKTALYVAKCQPGETGYQLDTERATRGVMLGISRGEDINLVWGGQAALHLAVSTENLKLVKLLLENGGDLLVQTSSSHTLGGGNTPLELAIEQQRFTKTTSIGQIVELLRLEISSKHTGSPDA